MLGAPKIVHCGEKIEEEAICKGGLRFLTVNVLTGFLLNLNQNAVANTDLSLEPFTKAILVLRLQDSTFFVVSGSSSLGGKTDNKAISFGDNCLIDILC